MQKTYNASQLHVGWNYFISTWICLTIISAWRKKKVTETAKPKATLLHNQKQKSFERCDSFARFLRLCLPLFDRLAIANGEKLTTLTKTYVISFARETKRNQERGSKETEPTCQVRGSWWVVDKEMVSASLNFPMHLCENEKQTLLRTNLQFRVTIIRLRLWRIKYFSLQTFLCLGKLRFSLHYSLYFSFPSKQKKNDSSPICNRLPHKGGLTRAIKTDPDHQEI